jgi:hypothetical protein
MIHRPVALSALAVAGILAASSADAWGPDGHQTVGRLADGMLAGTNAEKEVRKILGSMKLERAALWADCAKGVTPDKQGKFAYRGAGTFKECAPFETKAEEVRMVAFVQRNWTSCSPRPDQEVCHKQFHYTDVAIQRGQYGATVGTSSHDVVGAIKVAIDVLQGHPAASDVQIASRREALLLLAHYVGDIHQPLHVTAVYLSDQGQPVDPDQQGFDVRTETVGGNSILVPGTNLHHSWDEVPLELGPTQLGTTAVEEARATPLTAGDVAMWSTRWATDTISVGVHPAFDNVSYAPEDAHKHWQGTLPAGYNAGRVQVQREQLIKAGARLAQLLQAIWP